jgi:hypothetical protein
MNEYIAMNHSPGRDAVSKEQRVLICYIKFDEASLLFQQKI